MSLEEDYLRALMIRDARIIGKLDDIRSSEGNAPKGTRGEPWLEMGISRSVFYERLKLGKTRKSQPFPDSLQSKAPWTKLGIDRSTYYQRKREGWGG